MTPSRSHYLRPDWLPAVALSAALAAAMLAWDPHVGDLAAQVFRTELFQRAGLGIWNGSWYGGHYTLTYSVLFPPLAALLGPRLVGTFAVVASSYLFDRLVRDRWGEAARWATLWFAAGVVTLLADGQLTFALGVAFALLSLRSLQLGRTSWALLASAACALSSPVAAVSLAGVLLAGALDPAIYLSRLSRGWRRGHPLADRTRGPIAIWVACLALALVIVPNLAFPEYGQFPFAFSSYVAIPLFCGAALFVTRGLAAEERQLRRVLLAYLLAATVLWLAPNPLGGNAVRLGALFGGPVLAAVVLAHRPRLGALPTLVLAITLAGGLYWQVTASVSQIARSVGDPSTSAAYFAPVSGWLRAHGARAARIEVPPTANHWEAAYLAPGFELARGWLRQLDTTRDDIFYGDDKPLERTLLPRLAAQQRDPLRRPARRVARLLLGCREPSDPARPALPRSALERRPLARLRSARPRAPRAAARQRRRHRARGRPQRLRPRRQPPRQVPRPRRLHPLLVDRTRPGLPAAPWRVDGGSRQPARRLPGQRRLLAEPGLERGHGRWKDLLIVTSAALTTLFVANAALVLESQRQRLFEQAADAG